MEDVKTLLPFDDFRNLQAFSEDGLGQMSFAVLYILDLTLPYQFNHFVLFNDSIDQVHLFFALY